MINWTLTHPRATMDMLGLIPMFLSEHDDRPAHEQFNERYAHGGGWHSFNDFTQRADGALLYPGDPPMEVLAEARLRDEVIRIHNYAWVSITQPDGSFDVSRMD